MERLENEQSSFTTHSPTLQSLYLRHSSFSNPSVASSTSQFIIQPFFRFSYVTSSSLNSPGESPIRDRRTIHSLSLLYNILHTSTPKYLLNRISGLCGSHNLDIRSQQNTCIIYSSHYILRIFLHSFTCQNLEFMYPLYQRRPDAITVQK